LGKPGCQKFKLPMLDRQLSVITVYKPKNNLSNVKVKDKFTIGIREGDSDCGTPKTTQGVLICKLLAYIEPSSD
jgi:hypothetical protein